MGRACPRTDKSAGKTKSRRVRKGNPWLKMALVQAARAGSRTRRSYLRAEYYRLAGRIGGNKAIIAVAASILTAVWHMLQTGSEWRDLGSEYFDQRDPTKAARRLVRRLEALGFSVELKGAA